MFIKLMQVLIMLKIWNSFNPKLQLKDTEYAITNKLIKLLTEFKGLKFVIKLPLEFQKIESDNKAIQSTFYSNSKTEAIINESDIDDVFESIYSIIISNIQKYLGQGSGLNIFISSQIIILIS